MTTERINTVEASQPVAGAASLRPVPHVSVIAAPQAGPDSGCLHRRLGGRFSGWLTGPVNLGAGRAVSCPNKASVGHVRVLHPAVITAIRPISRLPRFLSTLPGSAARSGVQGDPATGWFTGAPILMYQSLRTICVRLAAFHHLRQRHGECYRFSS